MTTRISFGQISNRILERLFANNSKLEATQSQLSSGKRLEKASDNPVSVSQSMKFRAELDQYASFQRNIDDGHAYMGTVDSILTTSTGLYQNMRERAIQASNDTLGAQGRSFIGQEVRAIFDQMVSLSNTAFKGEYIFSGSNSQVPPYEIRTGASRVLTTPAVPSGDMAMALGTPIQIIDKNVDDSKDTATSDANAYQIIPGTIKVNGLTEGTDYSVDYINGTITFTAPGAAALALTGAGPGIDLSYSWLRRNEKSLDGVANREIEAGVEARINTTASDVYGTNTENNAWEAMITLMEGTLNNRPDKIRESIAKIDDSMKRQSTAQSMNGARIQRFESTQSHLDERTVNMTQLQSEVEDVDFAKAISDYQQQQAVYEASLKVGAQAMQQSLVNFL
jgi:flagellar hook-associated protein 3 FlgL